MLSEIQGAFRSGTYVVSRHGLARLLDRAIDLEDAALAVHDDAPEVIEDYPNDRRGPSMLILCQGPSGAWYHVLCAHQVLTKLVTIYQPDPSHWTEDFRRRKQR